MTNINQLSLSMADRLRDSYILPQTSQFAPDVAEELLVLCLKEFFRINPDMAQMVSQMGLPKNTDNLQSQMVLHRLKSFLDETILGACMTYLASDLQA